MILVEEAKWQLEKLDKIGYSITTELIACVENQEKQIAELEAKNAELVVALQAASDWANAEQGTAVYPGHLIGPALAKNRRT